MANRFWVGGTANWDGTAGSKWATTSGGSGGSAVPTSADDVFFDAASGSVTVTIASGNTGCKSIECTGFTGTIAGSAALTITNGSVTLNATMGCTYTGVVTWASNGSRTLTTAGKTFGAGMVLNGSGSTITLQDDFTTGGGIQLTNGSLDANNYNVSSAVVIISANSNTRVLTMGSGTWTLSGSGTVWQEQSTGGFTLNANTSTIKLTNATNTGKTFAGNGKTYYNLWITGAAGTGSYTISGSNTFNNFKDDKSNAHTLSFTAGTTQTVTAWNVSGTASVTITLKSTSDGSAWNLSCTTGTITSDYVSLQDSAAAGGATFNATHSTNVSGNSGWNFISATNSNFFALM